MNCTKNCVLKTGWSLGNQGTFKKRTLQGRGQDTYLKKCRQVGLSCLLQCHYGCRLKPGAEFCQPNSVLQANWAPEILNMACHVGRHFSDEPEWELWQHIDQSSQVTLRKAIWVWGGRLTFGTSGFPSKLGVLAGTSLQSLQLTVENESRVRIRISPKTENYFDLKKLQPL